MVVRRMGNAVTTTKLVGVGRGLSEKLGQMRSTPGVSLPIQRKVNREIWAGYVP